ncbi:transglutaminase-like cysteine peptidase [Pseudovibrio sp. SPO723]|uniref:transglutaminase-like cysteine peptidase n=1 Tax=Nesiotobacter zosterae TaxID=392721 RepID=UPI0029C4D85F|nr:transglutaminase-like cysteine peptidase [Pseudovibrio sp. SPO723]MDX5592884.1 transglutaminase-like cysteine peptidase [Pseudovibrio sp. SPO723]
MTWFAAHVPQPRAKPQRIHLTKLASANPAVTTKTVSKADLLNSRWAQINEKMEGYLADPQHCLNTLGTCKDPVFNQWVGLMKSAEKLRKARRLPVINRGINATLSYTLDRQNWGVTDYWASPEEALTRRRGDCEDYAILKYWSLALLGFDRDDMEVVAVFDQRTKQYHAILRIKQAGATYILDNRTARIRLPQDLPFYKTVFTTSEGADFTVASNFRTLSSLVDIATSGSKQDN